MSLVLLLVMSGISFSSQAQDWILNQPVRARICEDQDAHFVLEPTNEFNGTYQWQYKANNIWNDLNDSDTIHGSNESILIIYKPYETRFAGYMYRCELTMDEFPPITSDEVDIIFVALPTVAAGPDDIICQNVPYTLSGTASNTSGIKWEKSNGFGTITNENSIDNAVYHPADQDTTIEFVRLVLIGYAETPCSNARDTLDLTIQKLPTVNAGLDALVCENIDSIVLSGSAINYSDVFWTTNGNGKFEDSTTLNPTYKPDNEDITNGWVRIILTGNGISPCGSASDTMKIEFKKLPFVSTSGDDVVCKNGSYTLDGDTSNCSRILWTTLGNGTFNYDTVLNAIYTPGSVDIDYGSVDLVLTGYAIDPPCEGESTASMTLTIQKLPTVNAGDTATVCENDTYHLKDASASDYSSLEWSVLNDGDGTFDNNFLLAATYTPGPKDKIKGWAILSLKCFPNYPCTEPITDEMVLFITNQPSVDVGPDITICVNDSAYLDGDPVCYNSVKWSSEGDGSFTNRFVPDTWYTPGNNDTINGSVVLTLTAYGTYNTSDELTLTIQKSPEVYAGPDAEICSGDTFTPAEADTLFSSKVLWTTSGDGTFSDATHLKPEYIPGTNDVNGTVTLTLEAFPLAPCLESRVASMVLSFKANPIANAGNDLTICAGDACPLSGYAEHYSSVEWTLTAGDGTFSDPYNLGSDYIPGENDIINGSVTLTLIAYAEQPCDGSATDNIQININPARSFSMGGPGDVCANSHRVIYEINYDVKQDYLFAWTVVNGDTVSTSRDICIVNWNDDPGGTGKVIYRSEDISSKCQIEKELSVSFSTNSAPEVQPIIGKPFKQAPPVVLICQDSGYAYQWLKGNEPIPGATGQFYYAGTDNIIPGVIYNVSVTDKKNGCSNMSPDYIYHEPDKSLLFDPDDLFMVYPNPSSGSLIIMLNEVKVINDQSFELSIIDITGKVVMERTILNIEQLIDISGLEGGIYFIEIQTRDERQFKKIILY